jgi:membrane protease YdiL (CAAX protease family)
VGWKRERLGAFVRAVGVVLLFGALLALTRLALSHCISILIAGKVLGRGDENPLDHTLQLLIGGVSVVAPSVLAVWIAGRLRLIAPVKPSLGRQALKGWMAGFFGASFPLLALIGAAVAIGITSVVTGPPWGALTNLGFVSLALALLVAAAASEELVFRGAIQPQLAKAIGTPAALLLASVLFAYAHMEMSLDFLVTRFLLGVALGWAAVRTGTLAFPIGAHCGVNFVSFLVHEPFVGASEVNADGAAEAVATKSEQWQGAVFYVVLIFVSAELFRWASRRRAARSAVSPSGPARGLGARI